jgi:hypothetical protein
MLLLWHENFPIQQFVTFFIAKKVTKKSSHAKNSLSQHNLFWHSSFFYIRSHSSWYFSWRTEILADSGARTV